MVDTQDILIGIDAGTSVIKSVAFDVKGRQLEVVSLHNRFQTSADGTATQSLDQTWSDVVHTLVQLGERIPGLAERVAGVAVTAQGDGTWLVDRHNEAVGDGWLWLDGRSAPTARHLSDSPHDRARFEKTGTGLNSCQMGSQLAHMQAHLPECLEGADCALHCKDWIYLNLTGIRTTDPSEACFTFGDFRTRAYDGEVIEFFGLGTKRDLLPTITDGSQITYPLTAEAAKATKLLAGTPVCLGYVDVVCTALGAGIWTDGEDVGCTIIGTTGMHMRARAVKDVFLNEEPTGYVMTLPFPDTVAQIQSNMASTLNIDWILGVAADLVTELGGKKVTPNELIEYVDGWAEKSQPGALLYHPYISEAGERGPFIDSAARAGLIGLNSGHRFHDLVRAVLEGLGMAARDCYLAMGSIAPELRLTGGASQSATLRQIFAACVGVPVRTSKRGEAGAAGAAMIASVAIGVFPNMAACVAEWVQPLLSESEAPDKDLIKTYERLYPHYLAARKGLTPVWAGLDAAQDRSHG